MTEEIAKFERELRIRLPDLFQLGSSPGRLRSTGEPIFWPTEGLQMCHEAEKLLTPTQWESWYGFMVKELFTAKKYGRHESEHADYELRIKVLLRLWEYA